MSALTPQNSNKKIWLLIAVVAALLLVALILWKTSTSQKTPTSEKKKSGETTQPKAALTVTVTEPQQQNWKQTFTANGNVAAWQEVVIGSELSGQRITKVNVNVGDEVRRGQVLAEINADTIRAELAAAKASYAEAQAVLSSAITNNQRIQQLKNTGAISAQESTQYQTSQATAQARLHAAKAQIDSTQLRLAQTPVIAPDNGVI